MKRWLVAAFVVGCWVGYVRALTMVEDQPIELDDDYALRG